MTPPMCHRLLRPLRGPPARVLWFAPTGGDASWQRLGNWWADEARTIPANSLPTSHDTVVSDGPWLPVLGEQRSVAAAVLDDAGEGQELVGRLAVAAGATFAGSLVIAAVIAGNATFTESTRLTGTVLGRATFTGSACVDGGTASEYSPSTPPTC